jgi:signal transduction histidine kinase
MSLIDKFNTISFRISFSIAVLIAVTSIAVGYLILKEEKKTLEIELKKKGSYFAQLLSHYVIEPFLYEEQYEIFSLFNAFMADEESLVVYAEIYDKDKKLVVRTYKNEKWRKMKLQPLNFDNVMNDINILDDNNMQVYHISRTVDVEPLAQIGFIRLGITKEFLLMTIQGSKLKLYLISAGVTLLGVLLGLGIARKMLDPILVLNKGVKRVGEGEIGVEIPVVGQGEIKELAISFNKMSRKLKALINDIKAAQENLVRTEKLYAVGEFSAGVAHEIKNPLTSIKLLMQTLAHKKQAVSSKDFAIFEGEINRIDRIVKEFLAFARPKKHEKKSVNINNALNEVITITSPKMKQSRIELVQEFSSGLPEIKGNRDGLKQVFLNLVLNSLQAMEEGDTLTITTLYSDGNLQVEIKDTGVGIPAKNLKNIFDPFYTTKEDGTGMGLAIAYTIISDHSGTLKIESKTGISTTVKVVLPV